MMPNGVVSDHTWPGFSESARALLAPPTPSKLPAIRRENRPIVLTAFWLPVMQGIIAADHSKQASRPLSLPGHSGGKPGTPGTLRHDKMKPNAPAAGVGGPAAAGDTSQAISGRKHNEIVPPQIVCARRRGRRAAVMAGPRPGGDLSVAAGAFDRRPSGGAGARRAGAAGRAAACAAVEPGFCRREQAGRRRQYRRRLRHPLSA